GADSCQVLSGCFSVNLILTIDLMCLNPYFHGTASRSGAPFCGGTTSPYRPTVRMVSGCIASSRRRPSTYGQRSTGWRTPGICFGSYRVVNSTYLALPVGSHFLM